MGLAWTILMRATREILDNATVALQVSVVPLFLFQYLGLHWLTRAVAMQEGFLFVPGRFVWWMWALGLLGTAVPMLWMAVGWHRFMLLGERPWFIFPRLRWRQMAGYAWTFVPVLFMTMLVALVLTLGILLLALIPVGFAMVLEVQTAGLPELLVTVVGVVLGNALFLRYGGALVGVAVGGDRRLSEAWNRTVPARWAVVWLAVLLIGMAVAVEQISDVMRVTGFVLSGYELVSTWFLTMLNIGLLTTIYAFYLHPAPLPSPAAEGTTAE